MASGPYSKLPTADSATLSDEESPGRGLLPQHALGLGLGLGMGPNRRLTPSPSPGMTPSTSSVLMEDGKAGDAQSTRDHVAIRTSCERARDRWRRGTSMIVQTRRVIALLSKVPGTAPGIDVKRQKFDFLSQHYRGDCDIQAVDYSATALTLQRVTRDNLESFLKEPRPAWSRVRWISVAGINWQVIQTLALKFDLHPLAVEDVVHMPQRIKADFYDNFIYISLILTMVAKAGHHAATAAQQQQQRQLQTLHGSYLPGLPPVRSPMQRSTQAARFMAGALQKWDALREGSVHGGPENQSQPLLGASFGRQSSSGDRGAHRGSTSGDRAPQRASASGEKAPHRGSSGGDRAPHRDSISGAGMFKRTSGSGQTAGAAAASAAGGSAGAHSGPNSEVCSGFTSPTAGEAAVPRFTSAPPVLVTTKPTGSSPPDPRSPGATSVASSGMPLFEPRKGRMFGATGGANVTPLGHVAPNSVIRKVSVLSSQVSLFLMHDGTVLSVLQNRHETLTQPIVEQLRQARTLVRDSEDPSFLANLLVDAIVDHVYPVVDAFSEAVQQYETQVLCARPDPSMTRELHVLQGDLNTLKRTILPMYNLVHNLNTREEFSTSKAAAGPNAVPPAEIISRLTKTYLNDVKDHVSTITEHLEDLSAQCQHLSDLIFNLINYETNNATKTLAVVSVIFLPITFLAGVYGTNFTILPEKDWEYGYLYFWLACVTITIVFVVALKRMGITLFTKQ